VRHVLVVGGAGYIGSHMCKFLKQNGYNPLVLDNLVTGHRDAVRWGELFVGSMSDKELLRKIFSCYDIVCVMHFAAYCYVGESVEQPLKYYLNNVSNSLRLLESMLEFGVKNFIFSSTCATYGETFELPISEKHSQNPINPYGRSKLMVEQILNDFANAYGLNYVALRYFNAAGADPECDIGEDHDPETHLIPLVLRTARHREQPMQIFGQDYPTIDGTCVRDYIHVTDLAQAHLLAMERLVSGGKSTIYNLGNGEGFSVKQVIETARRVTGKDIPFEIADRRSGDPAILVGSSEKAKSELGWCPQYADLDRIIGTAWRWYVKYPSGYSC
jgi:UDP-glucose 4-epimerase